MGTGLELTLRRLDGTELPVEIALSPFDDGETHVVATVRDVTERRETQRRLAAAHQQVALLDERERIGRDLHDVVLQRLYGTGLTVQAIGVGADDGVRNALDSVIDEIDRIIVEVRTIVFTLGNSGQRGTLGQELADVVAQSSRVLGFTPALRLDGPVESVMSDEVRTEMMASMREALGNVARHAEAAAVDVSVVVDGDRVVMRVADDGVGPPDGTGRPIAGNGLVNLRARAAALGGDCSLRAGARSGAVLVWSVPYG
jgi:signal transduction histidine kinase